ncbi:MAG TPA: hypothetical protein VHU88_20725 [Sporichthyaceae bacterium]|jgi:hypothetical protein|nr:hypothetical protein [Sporichthyaceae bacterium]
MRIANALVTYPGMCPSCGTEVDDYEDSVTGVDHVCPVCLIDLYVPDRRPVTGRARARLLRTRVGIGH